MADINSKRRIEQGLDRRTRRRHDSEVIGEEDEDSSLQDCDASSEEDDDTEVTSEEEENQMLEESLGTSSEDDDDAEGRSEEDEDDDDTSSEDDDDTEEGPEEGEEYEDSEEGDYDEDENNTLRIGEVETTFNPMALPHQRDALEAYAANVDTSLATIVMACGSGKTLTGLWIAEAKAAALKHNGGPNLPITVCLFFPSLMLVKQTCAEWDKHARAGLGLSSSDGVQRLVVCSDATCADRESSGSGDEEGDEAAVAGCRRFGQVTTKADEIATFLKSGGGLAKVIFCTYQSADRIGKAQHGLAEEGNGDAGHIHLALFDEAHKTAGKLGQFSKALFDENVTIKQRIFMTATPRNLDRSNVSVASMDNKELYGERIYHLSFRQAVNDHGIILPYKVLFIVVDDPEGRHSVSSLADTESGGMPAKFAAAIRAIQKTMEEHQLSKAFSFHTTNKRAQNFEESTRALFLEKRVPIEVDRIDGKMSSAERGEKMKRFKETTSKIILANARVLQEGVDVPNADLAVLMDPKYSIVDVAQLVGRVMRKWGDKNCGYVLVPVFVDRGEMTGLQEEMDESGDVAGSLSGEDGAPDDGSETESEVSITESESFGLASGDPEPNGEAEGGDGEEEEDDGSPGRACEGDAPDDGSETESEVSTIGSASSGIISGDPELRGEGEEEGRDEEEEDRDGDDPDNDQHSCTENDTGSDGSDVDSFDDVDILKRSKIGKYAAALAVMRTLMQHDEYLNETVQKIRAKMGELGRPMTWTEVNRDFPYFSDMVDISSLDGSISLDELWDIVGTKIVKLASDGWDERYGELEAYKAAKGDCNVPRRWVENKGLASWVNWQRVEKKKFDEGKSSSMTNERIQRLEAIGFVWNALEAAWEEKFSELEAYKETKGDCNVPVGRAENESLANWVVAQRKEKKNLAEGKQSFITVERIGRLDAIGFVWAPYKDAWEEKFSELEAHKAATGNCNVPSGNKCLANWVRNQRNEKRKFDKGKGAKITQERIERLEAIGFAWGRREVAWEEKFSELEAYKAVKGHCNVPKGWDENKGLANWVGTQRREKREFDEGKRSSMTRERIRRLEAIGFAWSPKEAAWEEKFSELKAYKAATGHCNVPRSWAENKGLANWVNRQRNEKKKFDKGESAKITKERIKRLEDIGFEWTPPRGGKRGA